MGLSAVSKPDVVQSSRDVFFGELLASLSVVRSELDVVEIDAGSAARQRLADRLGQLSVRAASLDQTLLAEELSACRGIVKGIGIIGHMDRVVRNQIDTALERIEAYVQAQRGRDSQLPRPPRRSELPPGQRRSVHGTLKLALCGAQPVGDALLAEDWAASDEAAALLIDYVAPSATAHHEIASRQPAVIIIDGDDPGAARLVERLMAQPATDSLPIIVLGSWDKPEDAAKFVALGVTRTMAKPASPGELRRACIEAGPALSLRFDPLGALSIDDLGTRLAAEIQSGICDAADDRARRAPIDLGSGDEVLTVMWEAIARIRELVTAKSNGKVRFQNAGPIEALPREGWIRGSTRRRPVDRSMRLHEVRDPEGDKAFTGCTVVVAEDDLSTNWFLGGVLKQGGATVHSVYDGHAALDHVYRDLPDLVISDIVMPELDGYTLCRAIKRDVLLRSVPVVLLSWKADLLQRMRELGAGADGYLLKEASARDVEHRVAEVLRPRRAIAARIGAGGEVRGRLDGLTAHALLKMVCTLRADARVSLRDAHFLYEIEVRGGRPVMATRTTKDGDSERGPAVMSALIAIGDGRFSVTPCDKGAAFSAELDGSLEEQLMEPIAIARAAQSLISGAKLMRVDKVTIDEARIHLQLMATPEPSRGLLRALLAGASPRELVATGRASSDLLERVLSDAARQGVIGAVQTASGHDMLPEAIDRELSVLSGEADHEVVRASHAALTGAIILSEPRMVELIDPPPSPMPEIVDEVSSAPAERVEPSWGEPPDDEAFDDEPYEDDEDVSLSSDAPRLAGPFARTSRPAIYDARRHTPVLASALDVAEHARHHTPILARVIEDDAPTFAQLTMPPPKDDEKPAPKPQDAPQTAQCSPSPDHEPARKAPPAREPAFSNQDEEPRLPRLPMPSAWATRGAEPPPKERSRVWLPLAFGIIGIGLAIGARWYREHQPPPAPVAAPVDPRVLPPTAPADPPAAVEAQGAPTADADAPVELPLSDEEAAKLEKGEGMLEVVAGRDSEVMIDGRTAGKGPVVKLALPARNDVYEVRVKLSGEERVRYVQVLEGKRLRLRVAPPWSR